VIQSGLNILSEFMTTLLHAMSDPGDLPGSAELHQSAMSPVQVFAVVFVLAKLISKASLPLIIVVIVVIGAAR
jgi:hypothetical protein